jgi:(p)ppGpp synthase/HD superfamily hydrolase
MQIAQTIHSSTTTFATRGCRSNDLLLVHRAYELLTRLYTGHFQADGKPFVAHGVGVASILAQLDQPPRSLQ